MQSLHDKCRSAYSSLTRGSIVHPNHFLGQIAYKFPDEVSDKVLNKVKHMSVRNWINLSMTSICLSR
jgi:hypothetical protein